MFKELLDELDGNSKQTLIDKNAKYSRDGDCLHNFREGAEIFGDTPAKTCWGYMTKHLIALRDKVYNNDFSDREDFLEKCQDVQNYIRFLWVIGNDENYWKGLKSTVDCEESVYFEIVVYNKTDNECVDRFYPEDKAKLFDGYRDNFIVGYINTSGNELLKVWDKENYYYLFKLGEEK